ncbi:MAG: hypothetical protein B7Y51_05000 [Burkholderiales bacterium 28-67-8]|nr:MAG: hypothetical protein B7Y51_05000 [Burkholderiales bacterium 28-67-8]
MTAADSWADVPERYRGVWRRNQLDIPGLRDTTTWARWLQTRWHADLRVPDAARTAEVLSAASPHPALALQTGFFGRTEVHWPPPSGERCTWHRHLDWQPDRGRPDTGWMAFERAEGTVIETGLNGDFREEWERIPNSTGRSMVLAELAPSTAGAAGEAAPCGTRWLLSGECLMRVRPRQTGWLAAAGTVLPWPEGTAPGDTLAVVVSRHPQAAAALLDFEISYGSLRDGHWRIEHSTHPALEGRTEAFAAHRLDEQRAELAGGYRTAWRVLEWDGDEMLR